MPSPFKLFDLRWVSSAQRERPLNSRRSTLNFPPAHFTMLERMTPLTGELDIEFQHQLKHSEPIKTMPFVTTLERAAMEKGQLLALRESIRDLLEERFGHTPPDIAARLEQESDASLLRSWNRRAATIESAAAFQGLIGTAES